jgi:uncharacterized protein
MTRLQQIELHCPVCDSCFFSQTVVSASSFAGRHTDFHERAVGTPPLPFQVHSCVRCGYSGAERDFMEAEAPSPTVKARVWNELAPVLSGGGASGSEKYEAAAKIIGWQGGSARRVADQLLRAAWCCVDEGDVEAERFFRRLAASAFAAALATADDVAREERAVLTYLVGELWRRAGDTRAAAVWFDRVATEIVDLATQQWVLDAARQQRDRPREWFG